MALELKQGDIFTQNGKLTRILGICGEAIFLTDRDSLDKGAVGYYTAKELEAEGFTKVGACIHFSEKRE